MKNYVLFFKKQGYTNLEVASELFNNAMLALFGVFLVCVACVGLGALALAVIMMWKGYWGSVALFTLFSVISLGTSYDYVSDCKKHFSSLNAQVSAWSSKC